MAGGHDLAAKATIGGCPVLIFLYIYFFLLVLRKLFSETSFWSAFLCIYTHLAAEVVLFVFSSSGHKSDFFGHISDSFFLVFSHAVFSGGLPFEIVHFWGFFAKQCDVLWASNVESVSDFYAACKHLTLPALSISPAPLGLCEAIF